MGVGKLVIEGRGLIIPVELDQISQPQGGRYVKDGESFLYLETPATGHPAALINELKKVDNRTSYAIVGKDSAGCIAYGGNIANLEERTVRFTLINESLDTMYERARKINVAINEYFNRHHEIEGDFKSR